MAYFTHITSGSYYLEQCYFRRAAVAQRNHDGSESSIDIKLSRAELRMSSHQAAAGSAQPAGDLAIFASRQQSPVDLSAVCVAGKHKIYACARGFAYDRRIVGEQYARLLPTGFFQGLPQIVAFDHQIVNAGEPYVGRSSFDPE